MFTQTRLTEDDRISMMAAYREAVGNAAKHGNSGETDKLITVNYLLDSEKIYLKLLAYLYY